MTASHTDSTPRTACHQLQVATVLYEFIEQKVLPGTGVTSDAFWQGFDSLVTDLAPKNIALLAERDRLQTAMDSWHKANPCPFQRRRPQRPRQCHTARHTSCPSVRWRHSAHSAH